jgi:peptide/nickel transport system substrate-binding protein
VPYSRRQLLGKATGIGLSAVAFGARNGAAQDSTPGPGPIRGGTLQIALQGDPGIFDPTLVFTTSIWKAIEHIYDTLIRVDPELNPIPALAASWDVSSDQTVYTFRLRNGVVFHDGSPFSAEDVRFTYTRILDPATHAVNAANFLSIKGAAAFHAGQSPHLEGINVLDPMTVEITLEEPDSSFLSVLASGNSIIMSKAFVQAQHGDVSQVTNGTGPFMLETYLPSASLSLVRNPNYWEPGLPYLDAIEAIFAPDDSARAAALVQGRVDFIEYVPLNEVDRLSHTAGLTIAGDTLNNIRYLAINLQQEPFTNLQVRQAIAVAIDRAPILESALAGHGVAVDTVFAPGFWAGYAHELPAPDIQRAKALLAEAGYPDGFKTRLLTYAPFSFLTNAAIVVQEQLRQIGIEIDYSAFDIAATSQALIDHDFDLAIGSTTGWIDPHPILLGNFGTGQLGNATSYSNPEADELIRQGKLASDRTERAAIYRQLQELLRADLPWVPLYVSSQYEAMKSSVHGFVHYPTGSNAALRTTWIDQS